MAAVAVPIFGVRTGLLSIPENTWEDVELHISPTDENCYWRQLE